MRARASTPTRAYAPKEIKALKEEGRIAEDGAPVIRRIHKPGKVDADPLRGLFPVTIDGKRCIVEYEPDSDLRDTETVPLNRWRRGTRRNQSLTLLSNIIRSFNDLFGNIDLGGYRSHPAA